MKDHISKKLFLLFLVIFCVTPLMATHNRAGEITYVQLSDLTYEITITTFTYTLSYADRPTLDVEWGDNTISTAQRTSMLTLPNFYRRNVYLITHTYPGPGIYKILVQDPNRNAGVKNIPNSVNVMFSMSSILTVNPAIGRNSTPILLNPPYDKAAYHYVFIHNPGAFDPDGDSLSYNLTVCTRDDGKPIVGYTLPPATTSIRVDSISGDLIWDTPADTGAFNVAMEIREWRNGKNIGLVERDMQIDVYTTNNKPPVNGPLRDYCVEVGDSIDFIFSATDVNNDIITLKVTSGIYTLNACPDTSIKISSVAGYSSLRYKWAPCYDAVRTQPYDVIFKSDDNNSDVRLSDISHMKIKVLGPAPVILNAVPEGKMIKLSWKNYGTGKIAGFSIYRREGASTFKPDSCAAGVPFSTGFVKVGYIGGSSTTSYSDTDNGQGLLFGKEYTYRIVAVYPNGTESKSSNEITSTLVSGLPIITNVSVLKTNISKGLIYISWKKPDKLDTIPANGPYEYRIFRANGISGTLYQLIRSKPTIDLNDTTMIDTLNTQSDGYIYRIELWNVKTDNVFRVGEPAFASSVYLTSSPGDRKTKFVINRNVPWINTRYDFFRLNETTSVYDSIGSTNQLVFVDNGLINGKNYCYYVKSVGGYTSENMPKNLVNLSEIACSTPVDNEPPCIPEISVASKCESMYNIVSWRFSDPSCLNDINKYFIYFKTNYTDNLVLIDSVLDKNTFSIIHSLTGQIKGCYAVSAIDSKGNESEKSIVVCIDSCGAFVIPNVFTPNGDAINDKLIAKTSGLEDKIDFRLYNRNGLLIFRTEKPKIDWDGTYKGKIVSPGVYFYQCDVYETRISGPYLYHLSGFIHVITDENGVIRKPATK
ncbi:MAG TPA: gliding motility-associated C-terminal domain-containing protein [Bacteroidales bacterium]